MRSAKSVAMTRAPSSARTKLAAPVPAATSRTCWPGSMPASAMASQA
jgi:hypothetical protein